MRDFIEGTFTLSLVTKSTIYYPTTTYLDLGTISSASRFTLHTLFDGLYCMWSNQAAAFAAADSFIPVIQSGATSGAMGSATAYQVLYEQTAVALPQYSIVRKRVPENVLEFVQPAAEAMSTGSFTGTLVLTAWFEEGARMGPAL